MIEEPQSKSNRSNNFDNISQSSSFFGIKPSSNNTIPLSENFRFEKNKLIYYQTLKSSLRLILFKATFSQLEIFSASYSDYQFAVEEIGKYIPTFKIIIEDARIQIQHKAIKEALKDLYKETKKFNFVLEQLTKRVTSFRESVVDKMTENQQTMNPLTSPETSTSRTTSLQGSLGDNEITKKTTLTHVSHKFYHKMKQNDYTDIEVLAIHDCKLLEAGMLYWLKSEQRTQETDNVQVEFVNATLSILCLADEEYILVGQGGALRAVEQGDMNFNNKDVVFSEKVCSKGNAPHGLQRKSSEVYSVYLNRITKTLEVIILNYFF